MERTLEEKERLKAIVSEALKTPSEETAYFLGVVSGVGAVQNRRVIFRSVDEGLILCLKDIIDTRLPFKGILSAYKLKKGNTPLTYEVGFHSKYFADCLQAEGNRGRLATLVDRYNWVTEENYIWSFLSGYYDVNGRVSDPDKEPAMVRLSTKDRKTLVSILNKIGINNPTLQGENTHPYFQAEIRIPHIEDIALFVTFIKSKILKKRDALDRYPTTKEIQECYHLAMNIKQKEGVGAKVIVNGPEFKKYRITWIAIADWISNDPTRLRRIECIFEKNMDLRAQEIICFFEHLTNFTGKLRESIKSKILERVSGLSVEEAKRKLMGEIKSATL